TRLYSFSLAVPVVDLVTQLLLVILGFAFLFSPSALTRGLHVGTQPSWHQIAFALPLAFLAYTGLETVANLAEEIRRPGRDLPRSLFLGIGAVVLVTVLIALVGLSAYPAPHGTTELGTTWLRAPLMGIVYALGPHPGRGRSRADGPRCAGDHGDLCRGDGDPHRRPLRRPDLARLRTGRLPPRAPRPRHGSARARGARRGSRAATGRVLQDPR